MPESETSNTIHFWFEFASTYSYIAAFEIEDRTREAGLSLAWRPFLLGPIFKAQGWTDSPFNLYPAKGRYMWRDMERLCTARGLALRKPTGFPRNGVLAARVALVAIEDGWGPAFVRAVYHANFAEDRDIADAEVIADLVVGLGHDAESVLAIAESDGNRAKLRANTEEAGARGIFGAPSFTVGQELFWGQDRLADAVAWAVAQRS